MFTGRQKTSLTGVSSSTSLGDDKRNADRNSRRLRAGRLKKEDVLDDDDDADDFKAPQDVRLAQFRGPGRPRGFSMRQRVLRPSKTTTTIYAKSLSSRCNVAAKESDGAAEIDVETAGPLETTDAHAVNRPDIMNGDHNYFHPSNDDPIAEIWAADGTVVGSPEPLTVTNYTPSSETGFFSDRWEKVADSPGDSIADDDLLCGRSWVSSGVETDHTYARMAPTAEESYLPERLATSGDSDNVLARLTILNARSQSRRSCHNHAAAATPPPCIQRCTVSLNRIDDSVYEQLMPKIKLKLRSLKRQTDDARREHHQDDVDVPTSEYSYPVCDGLSLVDAAQAMDVSGSSYPLCVSTQDANYSTPPCGSDWVCPANSSGLDLLASVSSLTADRLLRTPQSPIGASSDPSCWVQATDSCRPTNSDPAKRRVTVYCIRQKCSPSPDGLASDVIQPSSPRLLELVRDFIARGGNGPVCGVLPTGLDGCGGEHKPVPCPPRLSEGIACNSLALMHNSCTPLYNGVTELA